jgi:hypothetical protein
MHKIKSHVSIINLVERFYVSRENMFKYYGLYFGVLKFDSLVLHCSIPLRL